jgi:hypothetical protein
MTPAPQTIEIDLSGPRYRRILLIAGIVVVCVSGAAIGYIAYLLREPAIPPSLPIPPKQLAPVSCITCSFVRTT